MEWCKNHKSQIYILMRNQLLGLLVWYQFLGCKFLNGIEWKGERKDICSGSVREKYFIPLVKWEIKHNKNKSPIESNCLSWKWNKAQFKSSEPEKWNKMHNKPLFHIKKNNSFDDRFMYFSRMYGISSVQTFYFCFYIAWANMMIWNELRRGAIFQMRNVFTKNGKTGNEHRTANAEQKQKTKQIYRKSIYLYLNVYSSILILWKTI